MLKSRLFDTKRLDITIDRLCHQLIENHSDFKDPLLIGLQPRGIFLQNRINIDRI